MSWMRSSFWQYTSIALNVLRVRCPFPRSLSDLSLDLWRRKKVMNTDFLVPLPWCWESSYHRKRAPFAAGPQYANWTTVSRQRDVSDSGHSIQKLKCPNGRISIRLRKSSWTLFPTSEVLKSLRKQTGGVMLDRSRRQKGIHDGLAVKL